MIVLGADTATAVLAVGLANADGVLAERSVERGARPRESLLEALEGLLEVAGLAFSDVDALAVGVGPGSFTGVRIGISTFKGLALGSGKALVGVSTLEVVASGAVALNALAGEQCELVVLADQGHGEVAAQRFRVLPSGLEALALPVRATPAEAAVALPEGAIVVGDAYEAHREVLLAARPEGVRWLHEIRVTARGGVVATLGRQRLTAGSPSGNPVEPVYIRPPDAARRA